MNKRNPIPLEEGLSRLLGQIRPIEERETLALSELPGRILAQEQIARINSPPFDRSPLDGYALISDDICSASRVNPTILKVTDRLTAGDPPKAAIHRGEAVRIMTGAPLPKNADCVVRQEDTDLGAEQVRIFVPAKQGENVCFQGEELRKGEPLFPSGFRVDWTHIGTLAGQGISHAEAIRIPRVGILITGDELFPAGAALPAAKIYDCNGPMLAARLAALHAAPILLPHAADDPVKIAGGLWQALACCDMILTCGGVSVGEKDYLPQAVRSIGASVLFHGIKAKPGSPVMAAVIAGVPVVSLSGNPFAAEVMLELLARPALEYLSGNRFFSLQRSAGRLQGSFRKSSGCRRFLRAKYSGQDVWIANDGHASYMTYRLAGCNCLVDIPAGSGPLQEGDPVEIILI